MVISNKTEQRQYKNHKLKLPMGSFINSIRSERNYAGIYICAFLGAFAISSSFTALPFVIKFLEGSDTAAGSTLSAFRLVYLAGCILVAIFLDRLRPKITVISALTVKVLICLLLWLLVRFNGTVTFDPVSVIVILTGLWGIAMVFLWPPLMGWLSVGHEGKALNRKLGIYNTSWCSGATVGPFVGGYLASIDIQLPLIAAAIMFAIAAIAVSTSRKQQKPELIPDIDLQQKTFDPVLAKFRNIARITLFTSFICLGLMRVPLGILMKYELNFSETHFGIALSIVALASTTSFYLLGKFQNWHFKALPFLIAQTAIAVSMIMIILSKTLTPIYIASVIVGITTAFFFSSHMFYSVSATQKRSGAMAVHEIILSGGIGLGALGGGYLSDEFGRRFAPYLFGLIIIALGLWVQMAIKMRLRRKSN